MKPGRNEKDREPPLFELKTFATSKTEARVADKSEVIKSNPACIPFESCAFYKIPSLRRTSGIPLRFRQAAQESQGRLGDSLPQERNASRLVVVLRVESGHAGP